MKIFAKGDSEIETKEQKNKEKNFEQQSPNSSCCQPQGESPQMPDCCNDMGNANNSSSKMPDCMKRCRWFPIIPVILGITLLLLGYYLDAEITRILWMIAAAFVILMGTFALLMMGKMKKMCCT